MATSKTLELILELRDEASKKMQGLGGVIEKNAAQIRAAGIALTAFGAAAGGVVKSFVTAAAEFEQTTIAFETMLGSADKAQVLLKDLAAFATKTPFQLADVEKGAKALMAFGIAEESIIPTLKSLGDVSAGLNVPLERLVLNYGQVRAQGKLTGREVRDFAVAGIPVLEQLADQLGKTTMEISDMVTNGEIGFPVVEEMFRRMTDEGGRFANLMDKQSKTFGGMVSNMKDQVSLFLREGGKPLLDTGKEIVGRIIEIIQKMNEWAKANPETISAILKTTAVLAALAAVLGPFLIILPSLVAGISMLISPLGLVLGAVALLAAAWINDWGGIRETTTQVINWIIAQITWLKNAWNEDWGGIRTIVQKAWEAILSAIDLAWSAIKLIFAFIKTGVEAFKQMWDTNFLGIRTIIETVFSVIGTIIKTALSIISGLFKVFSGIFTGDWQKAWDGIKQIFSGIWEGIKQVFVDVWEGLKSLISDAIKWIKDEWQAVKDIVTKPFKAVFGTETTNTVTTKYKYEKGSYQESLDKMAGKSTKKMASGGILTEPISGIGLNTGRSYLMGEAGPEAVIPLGGLGGSKAGSNIYVTVTGNSFMGTPQQLADQVQSILQRKLQGSLKF